MRKALVQAITLSVVVGGLLIPAAVAAQELPGEPPYLSDEELEANSWNQGIRGITLRSKEVGTLAAIHNIGRLRAMLIAVWLHHASYALQQLRSEFPDSYAGAEFVHSNGSVELEVWIAGDGAAEEKALRRSIHTSGKWLKITFHEAPLSQIALASQLMAEADEAEMQHGPAARLEFTGALDFKTGEFVKAPPSEVIEPDQEWACTDDVTSRLVGGNLLRQPSPPGSFEGWFYRARGCYFNTHTCTSGFSAWHENNDGILTSGHCFEEDGIGSWVSLQMDNQESLRTSLFSTVVGSYPDQEAGFAEVSAAQPTAGPIGGVFINPDISGEYIRFVERLVPGPAAVGEVRCIKSASPNDIGLPPDVDHDAGYQCGLVDDPDHCIQGFCFFTSVENEEWDDFPRGGSSGGPWFFGDAAAGTHTASGTGLAIYYRLEWARDSIPDLDLYCGGFSPRICDWP